MYTPIILQRMGRDVELLCKAQGEPKPVTYWEGGNGKMIANSTKFRVRIIIICIFKNVIIDLKKFEI